MIDPLPHIDHREIDYEKFRKNFYVEHEEILMLQDAKVAELRNTLGIRVGVLPAHCCFVWQMLSSERVFLKVSGIAAQNPCAVSLTSTSMRS